MISFYKYQGAGNDFILIDNRTSVLNTEDHQRIQGLCHRRFGIGADGLMLLQEHPEYAFEMKYYNADGFEGTMCGNGGRCIVQFAHDLGLIDKETEFLGADGAHRATVLPNKQINLEMRGVDTYQTIGDDYFLDTGSPHYVIFVREHDEKRIREDGRTIRLQHNCNVNFVQIAAEGELVVRTYERGVEDETYACGTGVVASSLAYSLRDGAHSPVSVQALGGKLQVSFQRKNNSFTTIWLTGEALQVYSGQIES